MAGGFVTRPRALDIDERIPLEWPAVDLAVAAIESAKMDLAGKKPN